MQVMARASRKKSWQTSRQRVSVEAALAIQRENVMQRLLRLRAEIGHPEKPGEPLPQDQAAARAGVTARQWQRWESGASVPYARNLSAVADAFKFDVAEFYDGPAGQEPAPTPTPFAQDALTDRLDRIEQALTQAQQEREDMLALIDQQNGLLSRQSAILQRIENALAEEEEAAKRLGDAEDETVERIARLALAEYRRGPGTPAPKRKPHAKSRTRQG